MWAFLFVLGYDFRSPLSRGILEKETQILSRSLCKLVFGDVPGLIQDISDDTIDDPFDTGDIVEEAHRNQASVQFLEIARHQAIGFQFAAPEFGIGETVLKAAQEIADRPGFFSKPDLTKSV
jgi:hypothetical protein